MSVCPRRFQQTYLDQLISPPSPDQEERLAWGNRFHLLMQQRELGLPIEDLMSENPQLAQELSALIQAAPALFRSNSNSPDPTFRDAEHLRTLKFGEHLLIGVYDLLIADEKTAQILDWKTYPRPQNYVHIKNNWQTRLYPYLLVETSDYLPEQISMTYWFVKGNQNSGPQYLSLPYDSQKHQQTQQDLAQLIAQLDEYLHRYEQGESFPQVEISTGSCQSCSFAVRCQRLQETEDNFGEFGELNVNKLPNLATIEEIPI
ncbi:PD-(D/E)XK nuclease family protein [Capilliphycus salinus ALCB114379]|uniref:PD-(D/E)XK nuclease family protein n=1 Tax=Capilliphycus salinus TaxID=2768948 RepID=UPI0039A698D2